MPHKFKIGTVVYYHPNDRMLSTARGTYTITGPMPARQGQQPEHRIKHFSEEFERRMSTDEPPRNFYAAPVSANKWPGLRTIQRAGLSGTEWRNVGADPHQK